MKANDCGEDVMKYGCLVTWLAGVLLVASPAPGSENSTFALTRGCLAPAYARATRLTQVIAEVKNVGLTVAAVEVTLTLPASVTGDVKPLRITNWQAGEVKSLAWDVVAAAPAGGQVRLVFGQGEQVLDMLEFPVVWRDAVTQASADYVPAPDTVATGRYLVGAIHCPLWYRGERWPAIMPYPDREPVLGWYDEGTPEVTDWEIKWALDHGISFFLVCWYRAKDNGGKSVQPALEHWLHEGLFPSRYGSQCKFAINFENGNRNFCGQVSESDLLEHLLPFWIENYFRRANYLTLAGQPVLAIYDVERFVRDLGGEQQAAAVVVKMRVACQQAGFGGLLLLGQYCWGAPAELQERAGQIQRVGLDSSWSYHWPTFTGAFGGQLRPTGEQAIAAQESMWTKCLQPNVLTLSMGWDSQPWNFAQTRTQWRLTPGEFRILCQRAKSVLDQRQSDGPECRLVLLDNWNEYGEGHYIFPTREHGFGYLDAVRDVFATTTPTHTDLVPQDIGRGPYRAISH
ncbi:MAG: glycoside hydrolase family 99-like domain-containing protein [Pirellulaceae bacterium]